MLDAIKRAKRYAVPNVVVYALNEACEVADWGLQKFGIRTKNGADYLEIKKAIEMLQKDELLTACARSRPINEQFPFWLFVPIVSVGVLYLMFVIWKTEK